MQKPASKLEQAQKRTANDVASNIREKSNFFDEGTESLESLRYPPSIFSAITARSRETVHLENESEQSLAEKTLTLPFNDLFINFFNPTPLVDRIKEEEKYGNTGSNAIGRTLVNGYESFSNFLNSAINSAQNLKKTVGNNVIDALNHFGGKLVGLQ
ncbi:uncharacterized protein LOC122523202 [Polistes fuscatus]|uniref:uncharacterized protein LOC122523202 n=1 Tax=Polistes fuscatus TaxID=30207 RepID=UPI001CA87D70|nr:uncharacterized protein LOC122523202 [Polistes fuscatus]